MTNQFGIVFSNRLDIKLMIMKKLLIIVAVATIFLACKSKKTSLDIEPNMVLTDTSGAYKANGSSDTGVNKRKPIVTNASKTNRPNNKSGSSDKTNAGNTNTGNSGTAAASAPIARDKGWSKAAKGATIGAGTGAVLGAIVSKDKAKGAVIGAVLGAGTGYTIGRSSDKKSGRVARAKARRSAARQ
jgi:hypothetical protein